ncbi:hypothetical protein LTS08_008620 [Lithohypha guttulata]|uniref:uncharacterized protein n=1 Tax=Lithohypha guttulata TaxID=1690604 RepID=UPI002DE092BD|nr:hypothetical protein LTS08_008620 [Lithohypha guttulata]
MALPVRWLPYPDKLRFKLQDSTWNAELRRYLVNNEIDEIHAQLLDEYDGQVMVAWTEHLATIEALFIQPTMLQVLKESFKQAVQEWLDGVTQPYYVVLADKPLYWDFKSMVGKEVEAAVTRLPSGRACFGSGALHSDYVLDEWNLEHGHCKLTSKVDDSQWLIEDLEAWQFLKRQDMLQLVLN